MITALARLRDFPQPAEVSFDRDTLEIRHAGRPVTAAQAWDVPTTGTVYGVALNYHQALQSLGDAVHAAPYNSPPKAPILYIKPRNTWAAHGAAVQLPPDVTQVALGPTLGVVIGRTATRISPGRVHEVIAGYTVVNDLCVPHSSYYRPAIRHQCRDGFCPIGPMIVPRDTVPTPEALSVRAYVNGELRLTASLADLVRPIRSLIADVTEFMTLFEGDVLLVGVPPGAPTASAGDAIAVEVDGVGRLENHLVYGPRTAPMDAS